MSTAAFTEWLAWVFDHPVSKPAWYWQDGEWLEPDARTALAYMTRLFSEADTLLSPYSNAQIQQGLYLLISTGQSNHFLAFSNPAVATAEAVRCIHSFKLLFRDIYARQCSAVLSHCDQAGVTPLNNSCYMWWDVSPFYGGSAQANAADINAACMDVMEFCLTLENIACQESALHGLGHFTIYASCQPRCQKLIDTFLKAGGAKIPPLLRKYAEQAREGAVQ